jgi:hypothetical protein
VKFILKELNLSSSREIETWERIAIVDNRKRLIERWDKVLLEQVWLWTEEHESKVRGGI